MRHELLAASAYLVVAAAIGTGCKSEADDLTLDGVDALEACDIRTAHERFEQAHAADPDHPQAALGFALTDLALLPEDPAVTGVLRKIGFTGGVDMQILVFGPEGVLARAARGDSCDSLEQFVEAQVPYPPLADPEMDPISIIDPAFTGDDVSGAMHALSPRLEKIAAALEVAAQGMTEPVTVEGGCGLGSLTLQAPELLAAAAVLEAARGFIQLGQAYDWAVPVRAALEMEEDPEALASMLNAHIGRVTRAGEAAAAGPILARALGLGSAALAAAKGAGRDPDGLFDWASVPDANLEDAGRMIDSIAEALAGPAALADITPTLNLDLRSIFSDPIDLSSFTEPLFVVVGDEIYQEVQLSDVALEEAVTPLFSPSPFGDATVYEWGPEPRWTEFDPGTITAPLDRYDGLYSCMNTP